MKISAAVAFEPGRPLEIVDADLSPLQAGEVLVEMKAAGICHTDVHVQEGTASLGFQFPGVLGHEGAGIVVEVGPGVTTLKPGDHVVGFNAECGVCGFCCSGKTNICEHWFVDFQGMSRLSVGGRKLHPFLGLATFATHAVIRELSLAKVRPDAPFDQLCYLGCGGATGIGSVINTAKVEAGSTVIVFGLGGVGLNIVQGARLAGATMIVGVDKDPAKEAMARRMGMTHFVNPDTVAGDLVGHLRELTLGGGDYTFEAVGNTGLMRQAYESARIGWGVCTVVGMAPDGAEVTLPQFDLLIGRKLQGSSMGGTKGRSHLPGMADWLVEGKIDMASLITGHLPLERINDGIDAIHRKEGLRSVVIF